MIEVGWDLYISQVITSTRVEYRCFGIRSSGTRGTRWSSGSSHPLKSQSRSNSRYCVYTL